MDVLRDHLTEAVALFVTLASLITGAWAGYRRWKNRVAPFIDAVTRGLIVLNGRDPVTLPEDPSVEVAPKIPGALERLTTIEDMQDHLLIKQAQFQLEAKKADEYIIGKMKEIEHEVKPNNGGSIKDSVGRIENAVERNTSRLDSIDDKLQENDDWMTKIEKVIDSTMAQRQALDKAMWNAIEAVAKADPPTPAVIDRLPDEEE